MSCNNRRKHFFTNLAASDSNLTASLGDGNQANAVANLEAVYQRSALSVPGMASPNARTLKEAERDCTTLFLEFQKKGIPIPTHSKPQEGKPLALPDTSTMLKYAEVYRTIKAASAKQLLPKVAGAIVEQMKTKARRGIVSEPITLNRRGGNRAISSVNGGSGQAGSGISATATATTAQVLEERQRHRCQNCGRFVAYSLVHQCPLTATPTTMAKALSRRLGVSESAYVDQNGQNRLNDLIKEAQTHNGMISFVGPGEGCQTTLDGALVALQQGYLPICWGLQKTTRAVTSKGQIVSVFDKGPLQEPTPPANPVEEAAFLAGLDPAWVRANTKPNLNTTDTATLAQVAAPAPSSLAQFSSVTMTNQIPTSTLLNLAGATGSGSTANPNPNPNPNPTAKTTTTTTSTNSTPTPTPSVSASVLPSTLSISVGSDYDGGRWQGHEFRKGQGQQITDGTQTYQVGDTSYSPTDYGTARRQGLYPQPKRGTGIRVGQDLVQAAILLKDAALVETQDAATGHKTFELETKQKGLVAAYDPQQERVGSVYNPTNAQGDPIASPEQMAALMAYMVANPTTPTQQALAQDVKDYLAGQASALQVSDGAYIAFRERFASDASLRYDLGGQLGGVSRCPNCGRFVGSSPCQCTPTVVSSNTATPAVAAASTSLPAQSQPRPQPQPQPTINPVFVPGSVSVPEARDSEIPLPSTPTADPALASIVFDSQQFARTLGEVLATAYPQPMFGVTPTPTNSNNDEVREALTKMSAAITEMANRTNQQQQEERMAAILDNIVTRLNATPAPMPSAPQTQNGSDNSPSPTSPTSPIPQIPQPAALLPLERKPLPPQPLRPGINERSNNPVEHMLKYVEPVAPPDPYLTAVDPSLGGQRLEPLPLYYQTLDPNFDISADTEKAIRTVSASLQIAWNPDPAKRPKGTQFRAFAFGGTSGTGKNTTARQIAAGLNMPYYEMTINKDTSIQEEIGQTVLTTDPVTGSTVSKAQLGKLGQAAASGAVICVNELVKANPGILGALQTMMEDGYIEIAGTEAGMKGGRIPVHPSTVFIGTFNPGYDGSAQRPDAALLSRLQTVILNAPSVDEQAVRLQKEMSSIFGTAAVVGNSGGNQSETNGSTEILARDYKIQTPTNISSERAKAAASFVSDLQRMARGDGIDVPRQIATASPHPAEPTPREAARFLAMCEATGDPLLALEQFKVYCDAGEDAEEQWAKVKQAFTRYYGDDGQDLNRSEAGLGPVVY